MRFLITGGCGFIGSNLVRFLIAQGHQICNIDALTYAGNPSLLIDLEANPVYTFHKLDIAKGDGLHELVAESKPDAVLHLASESHDDRSIDGPDQFIQTNIVGSFHLLQAALGYYRSLGPDQASKFRFLHVSTDEVFGQLDLVAGYPKR